MVAAQACPLNKPNKPRTVANLRAIQLLNEERKIFSSIFLERAREVLQRELGASNFGFIKERDKSELLWSYQWKSERAKKRKERFLVLGLDMSRAFDTPRRAKLLGLLAKILDEDCYRMARVLLARSRVSVKIKGLVGPAFDTNIGVQQGDCASPILFLYYEHMAIRDCLARWRETHPAADSVME